MPGSLYKGVDFKALQLVLCIPRMLQHLSLILRPTYNRWEPSTLLPQHYTKEVEDRVAEIWDQPQLHKVFKSYLGYVRPCI